MSSKVNVLGILLGHIKTLTPSTSPRISKLDILSFYAIPLIVSLIGMLGNFTLAGNLTELLVNFGSILTALLLSVLVLVFDQEGKLKSGDPAQNSLGKFTEAKKKLLRQLYFNICYAIILSITLALVCFLHAAAGDFKETISIPRTTLSFDFVLGIYITTPIAIFLALNVVLTVLMVVKRLHMLLTTD